MVKITCANSGEKRWPRGELLTANVASEDAEKVATFLLEEAKKRAPHRYMQGTYKTALVSSSERLRLTSSLARFAVERIWRIKKVCALSLLNWAQKNRPAVLFERPIPAAEMLHLQAMGLRAVCIFQGDCSPTLFGQHGNAFDFTLHDLCHLEKFADPEHYNDQIIFFQHAEKALFSPVWSSFCAHFDLQWRKDMDHIVSDMNGSPVFLLATIVMKLKMAVKRKWEKEAGVDGCHLWVDPSQKQRIAATFLTFFHQLMTLFQFPKNMYDSLILLRTDRSNKEDANRFLSYLRSQA